MNSRPKQSPDEVILDSIADGVFTVDENWLVTSFNRAAEEITGIQREEAIGRRCCEVFRANICESDCAIRQTKETGKPVMKSSVYVIDSDGKRVPISVSAALLRGKDGRVIGAVETFRDMSVVETLRKQLAGQHTFADIVSKNHRMQQLFGVLPQIAASDSTVLIEGESGTGKELFARAIHDLGPRCEWPLVAVNCATDRRAPQRALDSVMR